MVWECRVELTLRERPKQLGLEGLSKGQVPFFQFSSLSHVHPHSSFSLFRPTAPQSIAGIDLLYHLLMMSSAVMMLP